MNRHCVPAILILAVVAAGAFGQTDIGLRVGVSASRFSFAASPEDAWSPRYAASFGGFAAFAAAKKLSPRIELAYVEKGATAAGTYDGSEVRIQESLSYLECSAVIDFRIWRRDRVSVGVQAGFFAASRLGAKTLTSWQGETSEDNIRSEIRSLDSGIAAGLEGSWGAWRLGIRMTMGLADLRADRSFGSAVRNRSLILTAGYGVRFY